MNYSKNLRKSAMAKRVLILIGVAFCVGLAVGGVSVYAMKTHITAKDKEKSIERTLERDNTETLVYGAYDDRTFTQEISLDWGAGDLDFTPLDCKMPEEQQEFAYYLCTGYNMGEDGAARLWEKGIYSTDYTEKILNYQTQFNEQLGGE